jgi:hypothetical protein
MVLVRFIPASFFTWCEATSIGHAIRQATWGFAVIETFHIMTLAVFLGTIVVVDMRLLGFGLRRRSAAQLATELAPWNWTSMALMIVTGVLLFLSEANRLSGNAPFFIKMVFLSLGMLIHFTIFRKATRDEGWLGRLTGSISLICWFGVAFAGRAIAFPELFHL